MANRIMKGALAAGAALMLAAGSASAGTQINISIGDNGYHGVLPALTGWRPDVWNASPVVAIGAAAAGIAAIYLNVPDKERRDWKRYCGKYDACGRPVHFVKDDWYRRTYAPKYRRQHPDHGPAGQRYDRPAPPPAHVKGPDRGLPPGQAKKMDCNPPAPRGDMRGPQWPQGPRGPQGGPQGPQPGGHGPDGGHGGPRH